MIRSAKSTRVITVDPSDETDIRTTLKAALDRVEAELKASPECSEAKASLLTQKSTLLALLMAFCD